MAEIPPPTPPPSPSGAVPPKKETGKVQPKKETVRINLPPKPAAAPTIKLPTLPPGGPTGAPSAAPIAAAAPPGPARSGGCPRPAAHGTTMAKAAAPATTAPAAASQRPAAPRPAAPVVPSIKALDKALIYTAAVASLAAVGMIVWVFLALKNTLDNFAS